MKINEATILVVDDEPELLEIFSIWLRRSGASILTAPNGAEALKLLASGSVQALVSDIRMPIMDGVALVKRLHELDMTIPSIIFVSGFGEVDPRTLYALGVEAMLPKPLGRNQLLHALEGSLREREELWLTPLPSPPEKCIAVELPSSSETNGDSAAFSVGRGGCCFPYHKAVPEIAVDIHLTFRDSPNEFIGQGCVRWYEKESGLLGAEFLYIDPRSRPWVLDRMHQQEAEGRLRSFIPASLNAPSYITAGASMPR